MSHNDRCAWLRGESCDCGPQGRDADRIATLTMELAEELTEARKFGATEQKTRMELFYQLAAERADHERTKAEMALVRRAFDGEQEAMRKNVADTVRAGVERDTAVAESAAMRAVLVRAREQLSCGEDIDGHSCPPSTCVVAAIEVAIAGTAGRAIAERVKWLEEMPARAKDLISRAAATMGRDRESWLPAVLQMIDTAAAERLAALDANGTSDGT